MSLDLAARFANRQEAFTAESSRATVVDIISDNRPSLELTIDKLIPFDNNGQGQPVKIKAEKIASIKKSAADIGFITPIIVRKVSDSDKYEILSGHHRAEAARQLENETGKSYPIPAVIFNATEIDDDTAYQIVAELNTPEVEPLPSERCKIFNRYDQLNKYKNKEENITVDELCAKFNIPSRNTYYRYKNLIKLSPTLIKAVDDKLLPLKDHEKLPPRFDKEEMEEIGRYIYDFGKEDKSGNIKPIRISGGDISKLCDWRDSTDDKLSAERVYSILTAKADEADGEDEEETVTANSSIYTMIREAFPTSSLSQMTDEQLDDLILRQLTAFVEQE